MDLTNLVSIFEENTYELNHVPEEYVKKFGFACLANSLIFDELKVPKYRKEIAQSMQNLKFETLDSLISYIKKIPDDIDKLFAIFSYAALNVQYDYELAQSDKITSTTLEEVFTKKKAICGGFSKFFKQLAKKVGIDSNRITIKYYLNFSKGARYDPFNLPKDIKPDHSSVYVNIDGIPFISEPTWANDAA